MIERFVLALCLIGISGLGVAGTLGAQRLAPRGPLDCSKVVVTHKSEPELISDFDAVIQERFRNFDDVGVRRVMRSQHMGVEPAFSPEWRNEAVAVCNFGACGSDVALYIAGRAVLGFEATPPAHGRSMLRDGRGLSIPVHVTGRYGASELPADDRLAAVAKAVFTSGPVDTRSGSWTVAGRPIVARSQTCVDCHNGRNRRSVGQPDRYANAPALHVGDTLGAAIYAVRGRH